MVFEGRRAQRCLRRACFSAPLRVFECVWRLRPRRRGLCRVWPLSEAARCLCPPQGVAGQKGYPGFPGEEGVAVSTRLCCSSTVAPCWTHPVCASRANAGIPDRADLKESRVVLVPEDWW